ncbi:MAG: IMP dehydrogenase, partial [Candidatus Sungbacteria bacterium]|nr:IMP dehydrogenase [Candidatus Sungbacteria bacterium]
MSESDNVKPPFYVEDIFVGKTFNDFSINPQKGVAKRRGEAALSSRFSRNIPLNLPVVAANMDTVTGPKMCIAVAQEGGIGVLPRSDSISIMRQAQWVREVKRAENFIIEKPYFVLETDTVGKARAEMAGRNMNTLLVISLVGEELVGMVTTRGISLCLNDNEIVGDWMKKRMGGGLAFSKNNITSLQIAVEELKRFGVTKLPLVDKDFKIKGLITSKDIASLIKNSSANKDVKGRLRVGGAIGATGDYLERASELIEEGVDVIVMDTAHAHNSAVVKPAIESFRHKFGNFELVCGNVATYDGAAFLQDLGVDGVKVGIGSGYGCRTRLQTSAGVPQVQAIRAAWQGVTKNGKPDYLFGISIISDGGVRHNGHIALALLLGASCVMVGSMLAGTDETPGELINDPFDNSKYKIYRGMTSPEAKLEQTGFSSEIKNVEGQSRRVPYTGGSVKEIL